RRPFLVFLTPPPPISTLFPYTTLFRSPRARRRRHPPGRDHLRHAQREGGALRRGAPLRRPRQAPAGNDLRHRDRRLRPHSQRAEDRKSTRLNSSHDQISYAVFCLKKKK